MKWLREPPGFAPSSEEEMKTYNAGVDAVCRIRCMPHQSMAQLNESANGDECGGCVAAERDDLRTELAAAQARVKELESQLHARAVAIVGEIGKERAVVAVSDYQQRVLELVRKKAWHDEGCLLRTHNGACDCSKGEMLRELEKEIESL